jgi:hypothetical protein
MPDTLYSTASEPDVGLALRIPGADLARGSYYTWADGTWTAPFNAADHIKPCVRDVDEPMHQLAEIPSAALLYNPLILEYVIKPNAPPQLWLTLGETRNLLQFPSFLAVR